MTRSEFKVKDRDTCLRQGSWGLAQEVSIELTVPDLDEFSTRGCPPSRGPGGDLVISEEKSDSLELD